MRPSRRNLSIFQKGELSLACKDLIAGKAKENLKTPTGGKKSLTLQNSAKSIDTREELASIAGKAKERQRESGGAVPQKSAKPPIDTREELASIAGKAKENERKGGGSGISGRQKSDNPVDTKKELASIAGKAKERQLSKLKKGDKHPDCQNSDEREIDTKKELAAIAGT